MARQSIDVRTVFARAQELDAPGDRQAYLDEVCAGNPELRREVWRRLATDMRPPLLKEMCRTIPFSQLPGAFDDFLQAKVNRRIVVDLAE